MLMLHDTKIAANRYVYFVICLACTFAISAIFDKYVVKLVDGVLMLRVRRPSS